MNDPRPAILPEDLPPRSVGGCQQCELSGHGARIIWGEGNPGAPLFVVLDNPGAREDRGGVPFLCGTRETLQRAAYEAGLTPDSLYISYVLKCRPRKAYDKERARSTCIRFLWEQLREAGPIMVMCLGNVVCRSVFGDPEAEVKQLRGKVHLIGGYRMVVSYHPLAARRRPALYRYSLQDWRLAADQLRKLGREGTGEISPGTG